MKDYDKLFRKLQRKDHLATFVEIGFIIVIPALLFVILAVVLYSMDEARRKDCQVPTHIEKRQARWSKAGKSVAYAPAGDYQCYACKNGDEHCWRIDD